MYSICPCSCVLTKPYVCAYNTFIFAITLQPLDRHQYYLGRNVFLTNDIFYHMHPNDTIIITVQNFKLQEGKKHFTGI